MKLSTILSAVTKTLRLVGLFEQQFTPNELNHIMVLVGKAFGPTNIKHFSELTRIEQSVLLLKVPVLNTIHRDWPVPFDKVSRTTTTWIGQMGPILMGNTTDPKPIPDHGKWYVTRGFATMTTESGIHFRIGWRPDDVDGYITLSAALKQV